jgi:hypothetical protein
LWRTPDAGSNRNVATPTKCVLEGRARPDQQIIRLADQVVMASRGMWPTPQAHDAAMGNADRVGRYGTEHGGRNLNDWVAMWPTPTIDGNHNRRGASATSGDGLATAVGGSLMPQFVEWLLGLPKDWTKVD